MRIEEWPAPALEADLPSLECPPHVLKWVDNLPSEVLEIVSTVAQNGGGI